MTMSNEHVSEPGREAACSVTLDVFEGPLDLLLHLVRRHELEILDIPIAFVTEKYLEYLALMHAMDLEIVGDYLVMAATLAYLKSRELLPPDPDESDEALDDEDGMDPREALIQQLLEYQRFRTAAEDLDSLPVSGRDVFGRGLDVELPPVDPGLSPVTLFRLAEAFHRVLERARIRKSHEVVLESISVTERIGQLADILAQQQRLDFDRLFLDREWASERQLRTMLIVTLMSILELAKLGVIRIHQPQGSATILLEQIVSADVARKMVEGYDEAASYGGAESDSDDDSEGDQA